MRTPKRLDALQQLEGVGRRQAGAEIAQAFGAGAHDEGSRAELLVENEAVIAGIGFGQHREFAGGAPVEAAAVDDHAADRNAVPAEPFGGRVHDDVGAMLDRAAEIGRGKGVVDQERNAGRMRDLRNPGNIEHLEAWIADGLADHEPGLRRDRRTEGVEIARLDECGRDAEAGQGVREQVDGAAVERGGGDDMIAGIEQRRDRQMHRGHAARGADRADAALQRRQPFLEHCRGRVGNARVDVPGAFQIEQRGRVIGILKHIGRGLIDRHRTGASHGVWMLPRMQAQGFERGRFRRRHFGLAVVGAVGGGLFCHKTGQRVSVFGGPFAANPVLSRQTSEARRQLGQVPVRGLAG